MKKTVKAWVVIDRKSNVLLEGYISQSMIKPLRNLYNQTDNFKVVPYREVNREWGMSANIYWRTVKKGKDLGVCMPSSFIQMFEGAYALPAILTKDDIEILNGMRIGSPDHKQTLEKIIEAVDEHGTIEIFAEY